jgi:8-oxo-dGTP pyrophosphatase MutT (NUDIX family)
MVEYYLEQPAFAFDVETVGDDDFARVHPILNKVTWIAFATEGRVDVIPMGHPNGEFLSWEKPLLASGQKRLEEGKEIREQDYSKREDSWTPVFDTAPDQLLPGDVFKALKPLLFSNKIKVGHNIKFDLKAIAKYYRGVVPPKPYFDTLVAAFILDNRTKNMLGLDDCAKREFMEETGLLENQFSIFKNIEPIHESFYGNNTIHYCHVYFLAWIHSDVKVVYNKNNEIMTKEIGDIGWFSIDDAILHIRSTNMDKREILKRAIYILENLTILNTTALHNSENEEEPQIRNEQFRQYGSSGGDTNIFSNTFKRRTYSFMEN